MTITPTRTTHGHVVVLAGDVALVDHQTVAIPPIANVVRLIEFASYQFRNDIGPGVLLIDRHNARMWDLPDASALDTLAEAGWKSSPWTDPATGNIGWIKFRLDDDMAIHPDVYLGLIDELSEHRCPLLTFHPGGEFDPHATADNFTSWHVRTGHAWFGTPGLSGSDVLEPLLRATIPVPAILKSDRYTGPRDAAELPYTLRAWHQTGVADERHAHGYDASRMYLAAAINVEVAPWKLEPTGPTQFDKHRAGWWLIDVPPWNDTRLPDPAGYSDDTRRWLTTPTMALLQQLADRGLSGGFEVLDSYTGTSKRLFREWGETMEQNYLSAMHLGNTNLATAFKQAGARETIGLMNSKTYTTYRPDWYASIVAMARVNLWRKIFKVADTSGRYPRAIDTDCIWYGSNDLDATLSCPEPLVLGDRLGQFKVKGSR